MPTQSVNTDTQEVLDLAVEWGYLYRSSIGRKEGIGRNTLYVFNRRLAPYFKLDPSGYAAHMSVTPEGLTLAMYDPGKFVSKRFGDARNRPTTAPNNQSDLFDNEKGEEL